MGRGPPEVDPGVRIRSAASPRRPIGSGRSGCGGSGGGKECGAWLCTYGLREERGPGGGRGWVVVDEVDRAGWPVEGGQGGVRGVLDMEEAGDFGPVGRLPVAARSAIAPPFVYHVSGP